MSEFTTGPTPNPPPMGDPKRAVNERNGELYVGEWRMVSVGGRIGANLLDGLLFFVTCGIGWLVWSIFTWKEGKTPAKKLLHHSCVRTDTAALATFGEMCLRELVMKLVVNSAVGGLLTVISFFMVLGRDRQAVWDKVVDTAVVYD